MNLDQKYQLSKLDRQIEDLVYAHQVQHRGNMPHGFLIHPKTEEVLKFVSFYSFEHDTTGSKIFYKGFRLYRSYDIPLDKLLMISNQTENGNS